jgi:hypothetical protein
LSLFAVTGASKAIDLGLGPAQAVILGTITGVASLLDADGPATTIGAAAVCFGIRMLGVRFDLNAPTPPAAPEPEPGDD